MGNKLSKKPTNSDYLDSLLGKLCILNNYYYDEVSSRLLSYEFNKTREYVIICHEEVINFPTYSLVTYSRIKEFIRIDIRAEAEEQIERLLCT
jgi:hypothetical protein